MPDRDAPERARGLLDQLAPAVLRGAVLATALWEVAADRTSARLRDADLTARLLLSGGGGQDGFPRGSDPATAVCEAMVHGEPRTLGFVETTAFGAPQRLTVRVVPLEANLAAVVWLEAAPEGDLSGDLDALRRVAGALAHDFNNLLQAVDGNLELARLGTNVAARLQAASAAVARARDLTAQLEVLASPTVSGGAPVDLADLVSEVLPALRTQQPGTIEILAVLPPEEGPTVDAGARVLRQVVRGLVQGATDSLPGRRGTVRLRVGETRVTRGEVGWVGAAPPPGRFGFIEVIDDGPGFDAADGALLYASAGFGRGLGLSTAASVAAAHGGGVQVGPGACVRVLLPLIAAPDPEALPTGSFAVVAGTVLVVDDDGAVRDVLQSALEQRGYAVAAADDGDTAVAEFARLVAGPGLDCVVLDLGMRRMSGAEALRRMRAISDRVPIIATSGFTPGEVARQLGDTPPDAVLRKPAPLAQMLEQVRRAVELRRT